MSTALSFSLSVASDIATDFTVLSFEGHEALSRRYGIEIVATARDIEDSVLPDVPAGRRAPVVDPEQR